MKNIQVIDGALNCAYSLYEVSDETFALLFPSSGQDVEFVEDFVRRLGRKRAGEVLAGIWPNRLDKPKAVGIHGTLFFELQNKRPFYPNKKEQDLDDPTIQRALLLESRSLLPATHPRLSKSLRKSESKAGNQRLR